MLTYFDNDEKEKITDVEIVLDDCSAERTAEIYLLDASNDMTLIETRKVKDKITIEMSLFSTVLINLK